MKSNKIKYILFLVPLLALLSCESHSEGDQIQIRIQNVSSFEFSDVRVNTSGGENHYGTVSPGNYSAYESYEYAYRYAFVELKIGTDTFTLQPIDYVGETWLEPGDYTYAIDAEAQGGRFDRLSLTLIED